MRKTAHWFVPLFVLLYALAFCQSAHAASITVSVKDAKFNPQLNATQVTLQVVNDSNKDVAGFTIITTTIYSDGSRTISERDVDNVGSLVPRTGPTQMQFESLILHPGGTNEQMIGLSQRPGNPIASITPVIGCVVFVDRTAEMPNRESCDRIIEHRVSYAKGARLTIDSINKATADPANPHPIQDVVAVLKQRETQQKKSHSSDMVAIHGVGQILPRIEGIPSSPEAGADQRHLREYADQLKAEADVFESHSQITEVK